MAECCRGQDEAWWRSEGEPKSQGILCEWCGGWEVLDAEGFCPQCPHERHDWSFRMAEEKGVGREEWVKGLEEARG